MPTTPPAILDHLATLVVEQAPERLLLIGPSDGDKRRLLAAVPGECTVVVASDRDRLDSIRVTSGRFDIALVLHTLEYLSADQGTRLLSRLRDMVGCPILVGIGPSEDSTTRWTVSDFIALGFRRSPGSRDLADGWSLYRYDIHDYKTTPNWLSSRYWANPERWGRDRW